MDLTAQVVREKTKELLGNDSIDFSYITDDSVAEDNTRGEHVAPIGDEKSQPNTVWYGNNARYGSRVVNGTTYHGYWFENDGHASAAGACSTAATGFVTVDWHHSYLGKCPNGREKWSFTR